ncbi:hypothetical protein MSAN_01998400 [Mycena sanguinolenta]|uniref:Uncharacterized protein n=1 Tax=Mycena sanguinolenta TaxID=230812 RepID=A0A8H6XLH4_9AGAR|nr:hypothetical protein MSAN_01998400 [Mycena sanguinolenta]
MPPSTQHRFIIGSLSTPIFPGHTTRLLTSCRKSLGLPLVGSHHPDASTRTSPAFMLSFGCPGAVIIRRDADQPPALRPPIRLDRAGTGATDRRDGERMEPILAIWAVAGLRSDFERLPRISGSRPLSRSRTMFVVLAVFFVSSASERASTSDYSDYACPSEGAL